MVVVFASAMPLFFIFVRGSWLHAGPWDVVFWEIESCGNVCVGILFSGFSEGRNLSFGCLGF